MQHVLRSSAAAALLACSGAVLAADFTFQHESQTVATLSITDTSGGALFELSSTTDAAFDATSFIHGIYFQGSSGTFGNYSGPGSAPTVQNPYGVNAGTHYDWGIDFDNSPAGDRILSGDTVSWTISGDGLNSGSFGTPMLLHVGAINAQDDSIKIVPIPEPETYALMLAGLAAIGLASQRRRRRA
jgi:hypothetical protein